jgi:hypothetical protein
MPTQFYFKLDDKFHVLNERDEYVTLYYKPLNGGSVGKNVYSLFKGYEPNEEGLRKYKKDFKVWTKQLRVNGLLGIEYEKYYCHHDASFLTFKRLSNYKWKEYTCVVTRIENIYWEQCNNGGLIYCKPGIHDSYGYDFSSYYPSLLADETFLFPKSEGYETTLHELPKKSKLKVGLYKVKIQSENESFKKLFAFSKNNMYTNYSLWFAMKHKKKFNVTIELIKNDKPNAYLYYDDDLVKGSDLFLNWYKTLMQLKQAFPKNKLLKHLLSGLWGSLSQGNTFYKTEEEVVEEDLFIGGSDEADFKILNFIDTGKNIRYKLLDTKQPYKQNFRIKPFLSSYARVMTASTALKNVDSVVRIHTDGIVYNKPIEHNIASLIAEDKTTGMIDWKNSNSYKIIS